MSYASQSFEVREYHHLIPDLMSLPFLVASHGIVQERSADPSVLGSRRTSMTEPSPGGRVAVFHENSGWTRNGGSLCEQNR